MAAGGVLKGSGVRSIQLIRLKAGGFFSKAFEADARLVASPLPQRLRTLLPRCLAVVDETKTLA